MKKDLKEFATKTREELLDLLKAKREDVFKLDLEKQQNKLKNTRSIYNTKKEIARILTLIREKELASGADELPKAAIESVKEKKSKQ